MCVCAYVLTWVRVMCVCGGQRQIWLLFCRLHHYVFSLVLFVFVLRQGLSLAWNRPSRSQWLDNASSFSASSVLRLQSLVTTIPFNIFIVYFLSILKKNSVSVSLSSSLFLFLSLSVYVQVPRSLEKGVRYPWVRVIGNFESLSDCCNQTQVLWKQKEYSKLLSFLSRNTWYFQNVGSGNWI